jgi:tetratricopeptide (TPR) repeat protein
MTAGQELLDRALAIAPNEPHLLGNKATFLMHEKRYNEAIIICDRALQAEPDHPIWKHNREQLDLLKQGKIIQTRRCVADAKKKHDGSYSIENFRRMSWSKTKKQKPLTKRNRKKVC